LTTEGSSSPCRLSLANDGTLYFVSCNEGRVYRLPAVNVAATFATFSDADRQLVAGSGNRDFSGDGTT
jgi:hypothetical protein